MRTVPRTVSRQTRTLRTMVTKDERWTPATNRAGQGLIDNKQALELNKVVPVSYTHLTLPTICSV